MALKDERSWVLVIPVKHASIAKSRLATFAGVRRPELARAMAEDTVAAALQCPLVHGLVVVTDDEPSATALRLLGAAVVPDEPSAGLNEALEHGVSVAAQLGDHVGALSGDLPALRPNELQSALAAAPGTRRSFVVDAAGSGTTVLLAPGGLPLGARFGPESAAAHRRSGAVELRGASLDSLRRDVDTEADVAHAVRLGVGARTAGVLAALRDPHAVTASVLGSGHASHG
ncbi:MAG TPA: 2-phospho-L-lactate guanylyltransferase [Nocardioidaceae bacterium]|nr:2-phospho-L-lactate guanylyltransferase [Nocardioidaceae bacterium]